MRLTHGGAAYSVRSLPRLQPNSGLPEFGRFIDWPKSETSDFGWRVRVGAHTKTRASERPGSWVTLWTGDMGNSFPDLFRSRFAAPRPGRRKAREFFRLPHDATEVDVGETDQPVALLGLDDRDRLAGQRLADEDIVAVPLDRAIGAHATDSVIGIVPRFHDAIGI